MGNTLSDRARSFWADEDAAVSVEFVVIFPLLIIWFIGSFVFFDAYRSNSQASKVAYTVGDFMSRFETVDNSQMDEIFNLHTKMLPKNADNARLRISSICFINGNYLVLWSVVRGGGLPLETEDVPLSIMPVMADLDTVILTETESEWTPLVDWVGLSNQVWRDDLVIRPRFVQAIPHDELNTDTNCPDPDAPGPGGGGGDGDGS